MSTKKNTDYSIWLDENNVGSSKKSYINFINKLLLRYNINLDNDLTEDEMLLNLQQDETYFNENEISYLKKFLNYKNFKSILDDVYSIVKNSNKLKKNQKIELIAIETIKNDLIKNHKVESKQIISKESYNLGYDLEVVVEGKEYYFEVKGLSGNGKSVTLTPNEYEKSKNIDNYIIAIVNNIKGNRNRKVTYFIKQNGGWHEWKVNSEKTISFIKKVYAEIKIN